MRVRALWVATLSAALGMLAAGGAAQATAPAGKNGRIVFSKFSSSQNDIWSMNVDGTDPRNLTNTPNPIDETDPAYSPTGRQVAFGNLDVGDIFVINADGSGSGLLNLTKTPTREEGGVAWSPDGRRFAYFACDASQCDIWVMNADGSDQHPVTHTLAPTDEFDPAWSPDGERIAYRFDDTPSFNRDIAIMNPDGSGSRPLTNTPTTTRESRPSFSRDGRQIYFDSFAPMGASDVYRMRSGGSIPVNLTKTPVAGEVESSLSPDSKRMLITLFPGNGDEDLALLSSGGTGLVPLTTTADPVDERDGDWETIQTCGGRRATIVGDDGPDKIKGTKGPDVIVSLGGKDTVLGRGGSDRICGGRGPDRLSGAGGAKDLCVGGKGNDRARGCERGKL